MVYHMVSEHVHWVIAMQDHTHNNIISLLGVNLSERGIYKKQEAVYIYLIYNIYEKPEAVYYIKFNVILLYIITSRVPIRNKKFGSRYDEIMMKL